MGQCAVFIDGGYLSKVVENHFSKAYLDYQRLSDFLTDGLLRLRTYYYDCLPYQGNPPTSAERAKYAAKSKFFHSKKSSAVPDALWKTEKDRSGYIRAKAC